MVVHNAEADQLKGPFIKDKNDGSSRWMPALKDTTYMNSRPVDCGRFVGSPSRKTEPYNMRSGYRVAPLAENPGLGRALPQL
jgi:hypothetical protein